MSVAEDRLGEEGVKEDAPGRMDGVREEMKVGRIVNSGQHVLFTARRNIVKEIMSAKYVDT